MNTKETDQADNMYQCSCKGYHLDKLLQPSILIILATQELHGYSLIQELENREIFYGEKIDKAGVYRTLKLMEERNLIKSEWDLKQRGPAKKVYSILDEGLVCLVNWIDTLENYKKTIDEIISKAEKIKAELMDID